MSEEAQNHDDLNHAIKRIERGSDEPNYNDIVRTIVEHTQGVHAFQSLSEERREELQGKLEMQIAEELEMAKKHGDHYPAFRPDRIGVLWAATNVMFQDDPVKRDSLQTKLRPYLVENAPKPEKAQQS